MALADKIIGYYAGTRNLLGKQGAASLEGDNVPKTAQAALLISRPASERFQMLRRALFAHSVNAQVPVGESLFSLAHFGFILACEGASRVAEGSRRGR